MAEQELPGPPMANTFFRRAAVFAAIYALVDLMVLLVGGLFIYARLVGVFAGYYAAMDMVELREAGVEWGWTRYVVLLLVAVAGFLGFVIYAWRRHAHLQAFEDETAGDDGANSSEGDNGMESSEGDDRTDSSEGDNGMESPEGDDRTDSSDGD